MVKVMLDINEREKRCTISISIAKNYLFGKTNKINKPPERPGKKSESTVK